MVALFLPVGKKGAMNLAETIKQCLDSRGWTASKLSLEAGVPIPCITRILSGEREGMHSKNLLKLAPFIYPTPTASPGQAATLPACELAASPAPGESFPTEAA